MKSPWYDPTPGATKTLIDSGAFIDADLYSFTLAGAPLGVARLLFGGGPIDVAILSPSTYWPANQVKFGEDKSRATAHWKVGLDVDTWQVVLAPRNVDPASGATWPDKIGTANWLAAVRAGVLDGAAVQVDRAFAPNWQQTVAGNAGRAALNPTGIVTIFYGLVGAVDVGRSQVTLTINSHLNVLTRDMPRRFYQANCIHTLFDNGCQLNAAAYAVTGTIVAVSNQGATITSSVAPPGSPANSGSFTLGTITMTSGASQGFSRLVTRWVAGSPGSFALQQPFPLGVGAGDTFTAYPGCSKTPGACNAFANFANYGGEIAIPPPEVAL